MGSPSTKPGCSRKCWDTGSRVYHVYACINASAADNVRAVPPQLAPVPFEPRPRPQPLLPPSFLSEDERAWYEQLDEKQRRCPPAQTLYFAIHGHRMSEHRLVWSHQHAPRGSTLRKLLEHRAMLVVARLQAVANG